MRATEMRAIYPFTNIQFVHAMGRNKTEFNLHLQQFLFVANFNKPCSINLL